MLTDRRLVRWAETIRLVGVSAAVSRSGGNRVETRRDHLPLRTGAATDPTAKAIGQPQRGAEPGGKQHNGEQLIQHRNAPSNICSEITIAQPF